MLPRTCHKFCIFLLKRADLKSVVRQGRAGSIPAPGTIFWGYCGTSCALRSSSTRSSTVVHSLITSSAKRNLCNALPPKNPRLLFLLPGACIWAGCLALLRLCTADAACRPRYGCHNIQLLTTFYPTENPLQRQSGVIFFASSRYLLIPRILGYFRDIKLKSVAVGKKSAKRP